MEGASARHFAIAFRLALGCLIGCVLLQLLLYVRPGPYGGPFLVEWRRYFALALYYEMLGVWLLAAPFLLYWLARWRRPAPRRAALLHFALAALMAANLLLSAFDHELLRFLGVRLGLSFLVTYVRLETVSDSLFFESLADDPGGPYLALLLLVLPPLLYLWWARRLIHGRPEGARPIPGGLLAALLLTVVPLAAPANGWRMATGQFRLRKVEPVVVALAVDAAAGFGDLSRPADLDRLARNYQARWLAESGDESWRFPDPARPYLRVPAGPAPAHPPGERWNIIYVQLETFRGVDMGFLRAPGSAPSPSPTPNLDRIVAGGGARVWTRALSFGLPSINGLFSVHCSVTPHSRRYITAFTATAFDCLPDLLRRHGYRSEMFNAGDTDWDNSSFWLTRWYDRLERFPEAKGSDRPVFRAAAKRIKELGASGRPFLASVVSVTNHTPFRAREPGFDAFGNATPARRILGTTAFTDDVLGEFLDTLRREPWFAHTIVVITGDHGFNLGEHGGRAGQLNLHRESVWVPLIMIGPHPLLAPGRDDRLASLLDVAPTLADLLGLREANAWQGHSLLARGAGETVGFRARDMRLLETGSWAALSDPAGGRLLLFDQAGDWLQRRDVSVRRPGLAAAMLAEANRRMRLNDYLLRNDLIWRAPAVARAADRNAPRAELPAASRRTSPPPASAPP
jgi:hypothetical protein